MKQKLTKDQELELLTIHSELLHIKDKLVRLDTNITWPLTVTHEFRCALCKRFSPCNATVSYTVTYCYSILRIIEQIIKDYT